MMIIGLTGGIASGKSTVARMLEDANIPVVDADELARRVTAPGSDALAKLVEIFGQEILDKENRLDRKKLSHIVFSKKDDLKKLESILHPQIQSLANREFAKLKNEGHKIIVYMAPLIFEANLHDKLDKTMLVIADLDVRVNRARARDKLSDEEINHRIAMQLSDEEKSRLADVIIENNGNVDELYKNLCTAFFKLTGINLASPYHVKTKSP